MTASSKPAYSSRFIPREEVGEVSAWRFSSMDDQLESLPASDSVASTELEKQTLDDARQQALTEGFEQGHAAGSSEAREALQAPMQQAIADTSARMAELLHNTSDHLRKSEEQISRLILELACDLARQVVRREIRSDPKVLEPVIAEALGQLIDDGLPATVRMHPGDLESMAETLTESLGNPRPEFVPDPSITPGGCLVESACMTVDATLEKRWARAVGNLGLDGTWNKEDGDV